MDLVDDVLMSVSCRFCVLYLSWKVPGTVSVEKQQNDNIAHFSVSVFVSVSIAGSVSVSVSPCVGCFCAFFLFDSHYWSVPY